MKNIQEINDTMIDTSINYSPKFRYLVSSILLQVLVKFAAQITWNSRIYRWNSRQLSVKNTAIQPTAGQKNIRIKCHNVDIVSAKMSVNK